MAPYFDPYNVTEPHTTLYTLGVYQPPRAPRRWLPQIFTRKPVKYQKNGDTYLILPSDPPGKLEYDCCLPEHLDSLPKKDITLQSAYLPVDFRCKHFNTPQKTPGCTRGCYFLERGGDRVIRWRCKRIDCEGHVYCGNVLKDGEGKACFGKRGKRIVCLDVSWRKSGC